MNARVFVSCGQKTDDERRIARTVCRMLEERGFSVYLAIDVQTILDINGGIIRELKNSDCYLFVNFRREKILGENQEERFRGSVFSNQELAVAYALGFQKLLVINQRGVVSEGMLAYIGVNTELFDDHRDCVDVVSRAIDRARWTPDYSRRLRAGILRFSGDIIQYANLLGWFLYLDIHNDRPDIAALETTARLVGYKQRGHGFQLCVIRSPLKATGRPGFSHTVFPTSHEAFDLLCIGRDTTEAVQVTPPQTTLAPGAGISGPALGADAGYRVYLNSALDVVPTQYLPIGPDEWTFRYEFFAIDFPVLTVEIGVTVPELFPLRPPEPELLAQSVR